MKQTVNPAAKANLERVVAEEQRAASIRMAQIRMVLAGLATIITQLPVLQHSEDLRPTKLGAFAFFVVSVLIFALVKTVPKVGKWGSLAVAFVDVPMVALIQYFQAPRLVHGWHGIATAIAIPLALLGLSLLSFSRTVIVVTALAVSTSILRRLLVLEVPTPPLIMTMTMVGGIAATGFAMVNRLRRLVHVARKKDLVGKYILGERLGAGGMAEVFLGTYSPEGGFERKVAVKRILPSYAERPESVALFRREAELGAGLAHPNIVQVLDFGADSDTWFIAMEFVDGLPLSRLVSHARRVGQTLPLPVCVYLIHELAQALDYIHTRTSGTGTPLGLVHRDVNPPNVLVSLIGEVKLNDFGVARAADSERLTEAGMLRGKVSYAAPEQLAGQPYDTRADLWALGITAFELLALQRPFSGNDDVSLYRACLEAPIPNVRELRPDLPLTLSDIVQDLLQRDPKLRVQSAEHVVDRLDHLDPSLTDRIEARKRLSMWVSEAKKASPIDTGPHAPTPTIKSTDVTVTQALRSAPPTSSSNAQ